MLDIEKQFTINAFTKWIVGEALSFTDVERVINVFDTIPLNLEQVEGAKAAALKVRLRSVAQQKFLGGGG